MCSDWAPAFQKKENAVNTVDDLKSRYDAVMASLDRNEAQEEDRANRLMEAIAEIGEWLGEQRRQTVQYRQENQRLASENEQMRFMMHSLLVAIESKNRARLTHTMIELESRLTALSDDARARSAEDVIDHSSGNVGMIENASEQPEATKDSAEPEVSNDQDDGAGAETSVHSYAHADTPVEMANTQDAVIKAEMADLTRGTGQDDGADDLEIPQSIDTEDFSAAEIDSDILDDVDLPGEKGALQSDDTQDETGTSFGQDPEADGPENNAPEKASKPTHGGDEQSPLRKAV